MLSIKPKPIIGMAARMATMCSCCVVGGGGGVGNGVVEEVEEDEEEEEEEMEEAAITICLFRPPRPVVRRSRSMEDGGLRIIMVTVGREKSNNAYGQPNDSLTCRVRCLCPKNTVMSSTVLLSSQACEEEEDLFTFEIER
jgi:hypothetical protein